MRIDKISCGQFAGLQNREWEFHDGINVICGKNESGKSTMVNLLFHVLFQNAKMDGRKDKDFKNNFYPVPKAGSAFQADFIDGEVVFHTENGTYCLKKEWSDSPQTNLATPEGQIRSETRVNAALKELLIYGAGVYRDMLFSSQKNAAETLRDLLDAAVNSDSKQEVAAVAAQAFSESDGISADAIGEAIEKKIDALGKHWDLQRQLPARKTGRWVNGVGEVLQAYYDWEDAKDVLNHIQRLEGDAERYIEEYRKAVAEAEQAKARYEQFHAFSGMLAARRERQKRIQDLRGKQQKYQRVLADWPAAEQQYRKAVALKTELDRRQIKDKYAAALAAQRALSEVDRELLTRACPESREIHQLRTILRTIATLENSLCGMNLNAAIQMFHGHSMHITVLRTGEEIAPTEATSLKEAVRICIPDVMEMVISPANVNTDEITAKIAENKAAAEAVLKKYGVKSVEALEDLKQRITEERTKADRLESEYRRVLDGEDFEDLRAAAETMTEAVRSEHEIRADITALCGGKTAENFAVARETVIHQYAAEYGTTAALQAECRNVEAELRSTEEAMASAGDIPEEYQRIQDPEAHLEALKNDCERKQSARENAQTGKVRAEGDLENYKEGLRADPAEEEGRTHQIFDEKRELLNHWLHIQQVFLQQKENIHDNPMEDLANRFTHNLGVISGGRVHTEFRDTDRLSPEIYSGERPMDYGKLSEGTRESVSVAFRLAVLDHLFPEGGGVAVFDDPFTDMDDDRMKNTAELLKDSARRHQIIFLTCRQEYAELLSDQISYM